MSKHDLLIKRLEGYSGLRLRDNEPLHIKPGINLLVGRNGSGKSNLLWLIRAITNEGVNIIDKIESSFFQKNLLRISGSEEDMLIKDFGSVPIVDFSLGNRSGRISIRLDKVAQKHVLQNLLKPGAKISGHISTEISALEVPVALVDNSSRNFEMDLSGSIYSNLFSNPQDKRFQSIIENPSKRIDEFLNDKMHEILDSTEFKATLDNLTQSINSKLQRFFKTTKKHLKMEDDDNSLKKQLVLYDGNNFISSQNVSTGESVLLNIIVSLAMLKDEVNEFVIFDEPELHMHDDMIQEFIEEIALLSDAHQSQKILIATHSTGLIENLAKLNDRSINLIIFDQDRNVFNSDEDIQLIKTLSRNGVSFSPLMLTKKPNLFIENQGSDGFKHRDFLKRFFTETEPNIIPIGTSGNVVQTKSFVGIFNDILKTRDVKSWGIQDGDIWFKQKLVQYLHGQIDLEELVQLLSSNTGAYIEAKVKDSNQFYFNFWEIENLYLKDELIECWQVNAISLTKRDYKNFLIENKSILFREYFDTFYKVITRIRSNKNLPPEERLLSTQSIFKEIEGILEKTDTIDKRIHALIDEILSRDLLGWVPGKEIKNLLEANGYEFDHSNFDFEGSQLSKDIQKILQ